MSKVCQLFSGSSGNSILISSAGHNFLVDIGVSAKKCENALLSIGVDPASVEGIFVTHEHSDHTAGIRVFSSRYKIPVFATEQCLAEMDNKNIVTDSVNIQSMDYHMNFASTEIISFRQSHDSVDCVGYRFNMPSGRGICVCTDTGYITDEARSVCKGSDLIFIESNHETSMVEAGPYPYVLKQRILGSKGHLSNFACGEFIKELAQTGTTRFVLSHLSRENNMPHIARQTALTALDEIGFKEDRDFRLYVSPQVNCRGSIVL